MADSRRLGGAALLLLPAGLVAFFAFNSGGFYPGPSAWIAVILCIVLVLRVTLADDPFGGAGWGLALAAGALSLYTLLTLLSQIWSHAPGTALEEFDRALVYLLVMLLCGSIPHTTRRQARMLQALALAIVVICACALVTRLLPHLWPITPEIANKRLSFPLTYWNALGLFGAFGVVLALHFASDAREALAIRVLAAASLPVLATTIYFTFSRGGIAAAVLGLILYVLIARPKALISGIVAAAPATAVALKFAYDANLLATPTPTTAAAVSQGRHVAVAVIACAAIAAALRLLLGLGLDGHLDRFAFREERQVHIRRFGWATLATAAVALIVAFNGAIAHEYHRFVNPASPGNSADLRTRLTDPGNNGRLDLWRVAWHQFQRAPVLGHGAGTFANTWAQYRINTQFVLDAHSLYLETLDELGIVGFVLLVGVILFALIRTAARARDANRPLYAATLAIMVIWSLHAGIDWDWEMPAVTLPFFALGGFALARPLISRTPGQPGAAASHAITPLVRVTVGLGCLVLAVAPAYMWLSQRRLNQAAAAFSNGNCQVATRDALASISVLGDRPEPYEVISYCDIRRDMPDLAIAMIQKAISLDPHNWNFHYDLAVMQASAGLDPTVALHKAASLNPREPLIQSAIQAFSGDDRSRWEQAGKSIADAFTSL